MKLPTDDKIKEEIVGMLSKHPEYKECANCFHYDPIEGICKQSGRQTFPHLPAQQCRHYVTAMELLMKETRTKLEEQKTECEKIENLLAIAVTTANSTTCFLADLEKRMSTFRKKETDDNIRRELKKDLDMVDQMKNAMKNIEAELNAMSEDMEKHLAKADNYYQWYIQPHLSRMFSEDGKFNELKTDGHLNNSMEFCRLIMDFVIGCVGNGENSEKVFKMLRELKNEQPYGLTHKDADHYKLKGYNY
jgi:hypothetical protein